MPRLIIFLLVSFNFLGVNAASFDCNKAASIPEMMICNDQQLSTLDEELYDVYKEAKAATSDQKGFKEQSKASWNWREKNCHTKECLLTWYAQRRKTLLGYLPTKLISGVDSALVLSLREASEGASLKIPSQNHIFPIELQTYYNQTRLDLASVFADKSRSKLPYRFNIGYESDGEMSWEKQTNKYVLAKNDFTGDERPEIVFAVIDTEGVLSKIHINVFQYFPPANISSAARQENWELIGSLEAIGVVGDPKIEVSERAITVPRNHRGFYYEISWVKNKFINTGEY